MARQARRHAEATSPNASLCKVRVHSATPAQNFVNIAELWHIPRHVRRISDQFAEISNRHTRPKLANDAPRRFSKPKQVRLPFNIPADFWATSAVLGPVAIEMGAFVGRRCPQVGLVWHAPSNFVRNSPASNFHQCYHRNFVCGLCSTMRPADCARPNFVLALRAHAVYSGFLPERLGMQVMTTLTL